jgi:methyl-accepting chemotaxis protein
MTLIQKILLIAAGPLLVAATVLGYVSYTDSSERATNELVGKARSVVLAAESGREEMADKWGQGIFTAEMLRTWSEAGQRDKVLAAVPVVTAWRTAMRKANEGGYEFRVPKFEPRNPKNLPDEVEARVIRMFESDATITEHHEYDAEKNAIRYFRPIRLTRECLNCHGDPQTSQALWGNNQGLDPVGQRMENWREGEVHGAFEVVQSLAAADAQRAAALKKIAGIAVLSLAVGLLAAWWFTRRGVVVPLLQELSQLQNGAQQVHTASDQLSSGSQSLAQGASEQASALEETSASMEEMASMTRRNSENSAQAARMMTETDRVVAQSNTSLEAMVQSMGRIRESSEKVSKIIKTIDEIAFQTNILALNAAVEAARAGEAGMGFAVVADEVRNLAQRSAQAARDTASLIEESIGNAQDGHRQVDQVSTSISSLTSSIAEVKGFVDQVSEASRQQSQGIEQVSRAISDMEKVTQTTAAGAEQSAAASEELTAQAESSLATVARIESLIMGPRASGRAALTTPQVRGPVGRNVLPMSAARPRPKASRASVAEAELPMEGTGTFGQF